MSSEAKDAKPRRNGTVVAHPTRPGVWVVRVTLGYEPVPGKKYGKQKRLNKTVRGSSQDASRVLRELLKQQDDGGHLPTSRLTLGAWLDEFDSVWSGNLAPVTKRKYGESLKSNLPGWLRGVKLRDLRERAIQEIYNSLSGSGKAPSTVSYFHRVLHARLQRAVQQGHLNKNPCSAVDLPTPRLRKYKTFTSDQAKAFLDLAEADKYGTLWALLLMTGVRPEEALGLKWEDLEGAKLAIRRALVRLGKDGWQLGPTKTGRSRSVPIAPALAKLIQKHKARQAGETLELGAEYARHGFIFASGFGEPLHWNTIVPRHFKPLMARLAFRLLNEADVPETGRELNRIERRTVKAAFKVTTESAIARAGLCGFRPYDLRHTTATLLLAAGEHPKVVAELLGHSGIKLTLDTYTHSVPGMVDRAAGRLEDIISGAKPALQSGA